MDKDIKLGRVYIIRNMKKEIYEITPILITDSNIKYRFENWNTWWISKYKLEHEHFIEDITDSLLPTNTYDTTK